MPARPALAAAVALAVLLASAPGPAAGQVTTSGAESGWTDIGPDQSDDPTRIMLLQQFNAGYICLSILLAILGAACSLELLLRRTSNRGIWNLSLLVGAGISFGAVSCFALHFIGNNSLTLMRPATASEPAEYLTLAYDPGFTILSLVVSVASMIIAFTVMGLDLESFKRKKPSAQDDVIGSESSGDASDKDKSSAASPPEASQTGGQWWSINARRASKDAARRLSHKLELVQLDRKGLTMATLAKHERATQDSATTLPDATAAAAALGLETFRFGSGPPAGALPPAPLQGPTDDEGSDDDVDDQTRLEMLATLRRSFASNGDGRSSVAATAGDSAPDARASPSRPTYTLPSVLPPRSLAAPLTVDLLGSDQSDLASDASAHERAATFAPPAELFAAIDMGTSVDRGRQPSRTSTLESPSCEPRPLPTGRTGSHPNFSLASGPLSPSRDPPPAALGPTTPSSVGSRRRSSLPATSPAFRRAPQGAIVIQDQMSFEEFEHSAFGGGRLALIRGSQSSDGTNSTDMRRNSVAAGSERTSMRSRRLSALTTGTAAGGFGNDGWGSDVGSTIDPLSPTSPTSHGDMGSRAQILPPLQAAAGVATGPGVHQACSAAQQPQLYRDEEEAIAHLASLRQSRVSSFSHGPSGADGLGNRKAAKHLSWAARNLGIGQSTKAEMTKVVVAGTICGFGVAGMHYIGQRSITSVQHIRYNPGIVVASVVIACVAISAGLWIMFIVLRPKLSHSYLKRALVACFLGSATSAMHYVAMMGSSYAVSSTAQLPTSATQLRAKRIITALVASLAAAACLVTVASAVFAQRKLRINRRKRRGLVVTTALWDDAGNLLVSPEGLMPVQNIAVDHIHIGRSFLSRSFGTRPGSISTDSISSSVLTSEFDITPQHQAFIAALRRTWLWRKVAASGGTIDDVPPVDGPPLGMHNAPSQTSIASEDAIATHDSAWSAGHRHSVGSELPMPQSVQRFLERFSDSTARLAEEVFGSDKQVGRLGVLFDRILTTGFLTFGSDGKEPGPSDSASSGQMLFLIDRCTPEQKNQLLRRGFMFYSPQAVSRVMSSALAVPPADMSAFLVAAQSFSTVLAAPQLQRGKVYVSALVAQALPHGLQVAVGRVHRNILPTRELGSFASTSDPVQSSQSSTAIAQDVNHLADLVASISGTSLLSLVHLDMSATARAADLAATSSPQAQLKRLLAKTLLPLFDHSPPAAVHVILQHLVLSPTLIPLLPSERLSRRSPRLPSYAIVFRAVLMPNVDVTELGPSLCFESFKLFRAVNECYMADLVRRVVRRDGGKLDRGAVIRDASLDGPSDEQLYQRRPSKVQFVDVDQTGFNPPASTGPVTPGEGSGGFHLNADIFAPGGHASRRPSRASIAPEASAPTSPRAEDQAPLPTVLHRPSVGRLRSAKDLRIYPPPASSALVSRQSSTVRGRSVDGYSARSSIAPFDPSWMLGLLRDDTAGHV